MVQFKISESYDNAMMMELTFSGGVMFSFFIHHQIRFVLVRRQLN
jgi:hypothetical protein